MKSTRIIGALGISVAAFLWGLDGIVLTPNLYNLDVGLVVFVLHALPFLIMNIFLWRDYEKLKQFSKADFLTFSAIGIFGGSIGTLAIVKALFLLNFQHLTIVALIQKLQPIFAILMAHFFLKEKISKQFSIWALIAIIAGYFMTFGLHSPNFETGQNTILAAIYALIAAISFGSGTVLSKQVLKKYNFSTATFYRYGFTSFFMGLFILLTGKFSHFPSITQTNWIYFLIIALTTGSGAIFLYYYGLKRVSALTSTICELWFPISSILLDYWIHGSHLSWIQLLSAVIMIGSILRITWLRKN